MAVSQSPSKETGISVGDAKEESFAVAHAKGLQKPSSDPAAGRYRIFQQPQAEKPFQAVPAVDLFLDLQVFLFFFPHHLKRDCSQGFEPLRTHVEQLRLLHHPLLVNVLYSGEENRTFFFAEEKPEGNSLAAELRIRKIREQAFSLEEALGLCWLLCRAMSYMHRLTLHGFLNPQEIYLEPWPDGPIPYYPKVAHPGIRSAFRRSPLAFSGLHEGTVCFAPPEFSGSDPLHDETDSYGIGAILYSLLTLRQPTGRFVRPSRMRQEIPTVLDRIVLHAMDEDVRERYPSSQALAHRIVERTGLEIFWEEMITAEKRLVEAFRIDGVVLPPPPKVQKSVLSVEHEGYTEEEGREENLPSPSPRRWNISLHLLLLVLACFVLMFLAVRDVSFIHREGANRLEEFRKWDRFFSDTEKRLR